MAFVAAQALLIIALSWELHLRPQRTRPTVAVKAGDIVSAEFRRFDRYRLISWVFVTSRHECIINATHDGNYVIYN